MPDCSSCDGKGYIQAIQERGKCLDCNGTGKKCTCIVDADTALVRPSCPLHGTGRAKEEHHHLACGYLDGKDCDCKPTPPSQETKDERKPGNTLENRMYLAIGGDFRDSDVKSAIKVAQDHASTVADKAVKEFGLYLVESFKDGKVAALDKKDDGKADILTPIMHNYVESWISRAFAAKKIYLTLEESERLKS